MTEIRFDDLVRTFVAETEENLATMEEALLALEWRPDDAELINTVFRMIHSVKGGASCVGYALVGELAHAAEDLLDRIREGVHRATADAISVLLHAVDALRDLVRTHRAEFTLEEQQILHALRTSGNVQTVLKPAAPQERRTLRVETERIDRMVDLSGEIAISRGRVRQVIESLPPGTSDALLEAWQESDRLFAGLQELVMKTRMVPIGPVFAAYNRTVRDLARKQGKIARLVVEGSEVEIDHGVVDKLRDPITQMIRNAVDHGIEPPEARSAAGKDPCGRITVSAVHEGGMIVIRVADDGNGIDRASVLARGRAAGLLAEGQNPGDAEIHALILQPGFTTADNVNDLSGRGVGMDVVKRNVESLHGTLAIESIEGAGTAVTAKLPLTLAIIDGFSVSVGPEHFIIPLPMVTEVWSESAGASSSRATGTLDLRGEPVPFVRLRRLFDVDAPPPVREAFVIVECGSRRAGLAVDQLHGDAQVVVKPMSDLFRALPGIAGSAILGNGRVALILDVPLLLEQLHAIHQKESIA